MRERWSDGNVLQPESPFRAEKDLYCHSQMTVARQKSTKDLKHLYFSMKSPDVEGLENKFSLHLHTGQIKQIGDPEVISYFHSLERGLYALLGYEKSKANGIKELAKASVENGCTQKQN